MFAKRKQICWTNTYDICSLFVPHICVTILYVYMIFGVSSMYTECMFYMQVEALLQEADTEGALQVLEELVEATEDLGTPIFPRDLDTAIDVVNQTLTQLVAEFDMNRDNVSCDS